MMQQEPTRDTFAPPFDLSTPHAWRMLARAYRAAHAADEAAVEAFYAAEDAACADADYREAAPHETHSDELARVAHNETVMTRYGVHAADERQREASEWRFELVHAALAAPAPDLQALALKLEMISDEGGWSDFDDSTWLLFVADLRRLCGLSVEPQQ